MEIGIVPDDRAPALPKETPLALIDLLQTQSAATARRLMVDQNDLRMTNRAPAALGEAEAEINVI